MWTQFWDMHSGGNAKLFWENIFIEAPEEQACELFEKFFDRNPRNASCDCCGDDYAIDTVETLSQATAFHRGCDWRGDGYTERARTGSRLLTTLEYVHSPGVLVIHADELDDFDIRVAQQRQLAHNPAE